jgi:hypothetical protein
MAKSIDEMTEDELISEITRLQATRVPSASKPKQPKRLDERKKKDPTKLTWRDQLFGDD